MQQATTGRTHLRDEELQVAEVEPEGEELAAVVAQRLQHVALELKVASKVVLVHGLQTHTQGGGGREHG